MPFGGYITIKKGDNVAKFKDSLYSSSRMGFFIYFFKELEKILDVENYEYDIEENEDIERIDGDEAEKSRSWFDLLKTRLASLKNWKVKENIDESTQNLEVDDNENYSNLYKQRGNSNTKDWYSFIGITLVWRIDDNRGRCPSY